MGYYIPMSNKGGTTQQVVKHTLEMGLKGLAPLVIGNLNTNLDFPWDR